MRSSIVVVVRQPKICPLVELRSDVKLEKWGEGNSSYYKGRGSRGSSTIY
jgi:hypothetical protein